MKLTHTVKNNFLFKMLQNLCTQFNKKLTVLFVKKIFFGKFNKITTIYSEKVYSLDSLIISFFLYSLTDTAV